MQQYILTDALIQARRMSILFHEVIDLSRQLAEAVDRNDQVTIQMLISMRREPIQKLVQADQAMNAQVIALPQEEGRRLAALLQGEKGMDKDEQILAAQVMTNRRLLAQMMEIDKVLNCKLTRDKSIYS